MVGGVSYRVDSATRRWQWISLAACIIQVPARSSEVFAQLCAHIHQFQHRAWARFIGGRGLEKAFLKINAPLLLFVLASGLMYFKNAYRQYRVAAKADGEDRSELKPMCHIPSAPDSPA